MRNLLLASAAALSLSLAVPAMAQSTGAPASNITRSDTSSDIAPKLPTPPVSNNGTPRAYLQAARDALGSHRTGEAQEALERAEARLLDRSTAAQNPGVDNAPMVKRVTDAREALGRGDVDGAARIVDAALATPMNRQANAAPMPVAGQVPSTGMGMSAAGGPPVVAGQMPATGVTVYGSGETTLPASDDSETFRNGNGNNAVTSHASPSREDPVEDTGSGANSPE